MAAGRKTALFSEFRGLSPKEGAHQADDRACRTWSLLCPLTLHLKKKPQEVERPLYCSLTSQKWVICARCYAPPPPQGDDLTTASVLFVNTLLLLFVSLQTLPLHPPPPPTLKIHPARPQSESESERERPHDSWAILYKEIVSDSTPLSCDVCHLMYDSLHRDWRRKV